MDEERKPTIVYLPDNFSDGTAIMGMNVKIKWAIQGVPVIALFVFAIFVLGHSLSLKVKFIMLILSCAPVLVLAVSGINGESVVEFLMHFFKYRKSRRVCFYNPRVKLEVKSLSENPSQIKALPRDKIMNFIENRKINKGSRKVDLQEVDMDSLVFADDPLSGEE